MNWKSWPYWVKGALLGIIFAIIFAMVIVSISNPSPGGPSATEVAFLLGIMVIGETFGYSFDFFYWSSAVIVHLGIFALIGALIGYLYSKFKNRKTKSLPI